MKCPIIGCNEDPAPGYECCSSLHGMMLRVARESVNQVLSANTRPWGLMQWKEYFYGEPTVADYEYYSNI